MQQLTPGFCLPGNAPPILTAPFYTTAGRFQCDLIGRVGGLYILQAATSLTVGHWQNLITSAAPFTFARQRQFS
jgi:hypothetical protein